MISVRLIGGCPKWSSEMLICFLNNFLYSQLLHTTSIVLRVSLLSLWTHTHTHMAGSIKLAATPRLCFAIWLQLLPSDVTPTEARHIKCQAGRHPRWPGHITQTSTQHVQLTTSQRYTSRELQQGCKKEKDMERKNSLNWLYLQRIQRKTHTGDCFVAFNAFSVDFNSL